MNTLYKLTGYLRHSDFEMLDQISGLKQKKQTPPLNSACLN